MKLDFDKYHSLQYCDNEQCAYHDQVGKGNVRILTRQHNQVYCNGCKNRWVLTKDTFFYGLRKPKELIISVLLDLSEGKGNRAIERTHGVRCSTQQQWIIRAGEHLDEVSALLQANMHLTRVQIDEFWSFLLKKRELHRNRTSQRSH